jgi:hypothetical protein
MPILAVIAFLVLGSALCAGKLYLNEQRRRARMEAWCVAAGKAGFQEFVVEPWGGARLAGGGKPQVRFQEYSKRNEVVGTRVAVTCGGDITLKPETLGTAFEKTIAGMGEIEVGDEEFDRQVCIRGMPDVVRAVLNAETRALVLALLRKDLPPVGPVDEVAVRDGQLEWELAEDSPGVLRDVLPHALECLLDLARRLSPPADLPAKVAENLATEREWRVRLESVRLLAAHSAHAAARDGLARSCADERVEVRIEAALAVGGEEVRATLVEAALRAATDDRLAARAVTALDNATPPRTFLRLLGGALRTKRTAAAVACIGRLGSLGVPEVIYPLTKLLAVEGSDVAAAAAKALGVSAAAAGEDPLLEALGHSEAAVSIAAAEALGRVGSVTAVLRLQEAAENHRFDGELRRTCRQAVAQIQARLPGATPGQLSLSETDAGRLSLAESDAAGRVAIVESDERR